MINKHITNKILNIDMENEYKLHDSSEAPSGGDTVVQIRDFTLESGRVIEKMDIKLHYFGSCSEKNDNVTIVCHALTGHSKVNEWWSNLFTGKDSIGSLFDVTKDFVVCINLLGSPSNPTNPNGLKGLAEYNESFYSDITVRDQANIQSLVLDNLLVSYSVKTIIGGSLGGMIAQELCYKLRSKGTEVRSLILVACGRILHPWQRGFSELQRSSITTAKSLEVGLALARNIALMSYRSHQSYEQKFISKPDEICNYFAHQRKRFLKRFNPYSYLSLLHTMDTHNFNKQVEEVPTLIVSLSSDILYPLQEQVAIMKAFSICEHVVLETPHGHDGFLLEQEALSSLCCRFHEKYKVT